MSEELIKEVRDNHQAKIYLQLSIMAGLSDDEIEQMNQIIDLSKRDPVLSYLIGRIDEMISENMGLLTEEFINYYQDQRAWLREYIESVPRIIDSWRYRQEILKLDGFYRGPIDGRRGIDTYNAFEMQEKSSS